MLRKAEVIATLLCFEGSEAEQDRLSTGSALTVVT